MKYNINLLSRKELSLFDQVVHFSLNYLRYILVVTQLVVIAVLFFRFKIDNDILDLKDQISQKEEIIRVTKPLLDQAETLDNQVAGISTSISTQNGLEASLNYLAATFPQTIFLSDFKIDKGTYTLEGSTTNSADVQRFYHKLQEDARFKQVTLSGLKKDPTGGVKFSIILSGFQNI